MTTANYLAVDHGAESGRGVLGRFDGERVATEEVHRFPNVPVRLPDGLHWDALRLLAETETAVAAGAARAGGALDGIGVDTWGVDFGLLDRDGGLVANPYHYRDPRTAGALARAHALVPRDEIYATTGTQDLPFNTLGQLVAMEGSPRLEVARTLLPMPDLLRYWLSGEVGAEATVASTTQLYGHAEGDWARGLIARLGIPAGLFPPLVPAGTAAGRLLPAVGDEIGLPGGGCPPVVAVASHDTASAVAAVPAEGADFAYVSSGTWSLVGVELPSPVLTAAAMRANFTNEGGLGGMVRFLKNVMGLWLLQESRRTWARRGEEYGYDELIALAAAAPPFGPIVDPDHEAFLPPGDQPARLAARCRATGQAPPETPGATVRCVLESLAAKYRWVIERAEALTGRLVRTIHIVGGGARNVLLCQMTADATGRPVLAGPVEATALGNLLVQALARGRLGSPGDIRAVVRRSVTVDRYDPDPAAAPRWDEAMARLEATMAVG